MKTITNELISTNQTVMSERQTRDHSEKSIFEMLKDIDDKVRA